MSNRIFRITRGLSLGKTLDEVQRYLNDLASYRRSSSVISTTSHTIDFSSSVYLVDDDTAGGAVTVNLMSALSAKGRTFVFKKLGTTGNVTLDGNSSETIDSAATKVLSSQYDIVVIYSDGAEWHII